MTGRSRTQAAIDAGYVNGPAPSYLLELEAELDAATELYSQVTESQMELLRAGASAGYWASIAGIA